MRTLRYIAMFFVLCALLCAQSDKPAASGQSTKPEKPDKDGKLDRDAGKSGKDVPRVFLLDGKALASAKAEAKKDDDLLKAARAEADKAMPLGPFSVMQKDRMPPSGDKHDYMSLARYYWPDPSKPDGLPYINRDGQTNPEISKITDHDYMDRMEKAARTLALGWYLTGDETYAQRSALLMRSWFLDPATRMNPNLNFGQGIPGITTGRKTGIIDSRGLTNVVEAIGLLAGSKAWSAADQQGLEKWFRDYLEWLQKSENGRGEAEEKNNHGTYYDVQVTDFALFTGQTKLAREVLEAAKEKRIARQVEPDGKQPFELARTRSFSYSAMNLHGLMDLARLGEAAGVDLWNWRTKDGRGIRMAVEFLLPYAAKEKKWEFDQITDLPDRELAQLLLKAATHYNEPRYSAVADKSGGTTNDLETLLLKRKLQK